MEFRHDVKIHSVNAADECQRNEDGRNDCQNLDNFIQPLTNIRQIEIDHISNNVPKTFYRFNRIDSMIVNIPKINPRTLRN